MNVVGERIIVFGDSLSHVGPDKGPTIVDIRGPILTSAPGGVLAQELVARGAQAARVDALVGRSARGFVGGAEVDKQFLLASDRAFRPTKVIVMLGTNDIDLGVTPAAIAATQAAMTQIRDAYRAMGAEVFAIGPPSFVDQEHAQGAPIMLQAVRGVFGADHTLDMRPLTADAERTNDGIHFTQAGAALVGPRLAQGVIALGVPVATASTGMSAGTKIALGVLGVAGFIGLSWLALRVAKNAAQKPEFGRRRELGIVDERLINRIAQALSYEVPVSEIHDQLVDEGYSEEDIYLGYKAAKQYLKHVDEPLPKWVKPDPEAHGLGAIVAARRRR